ncbi:MAG: bifunctional phosphopantothenoylcysteine decarboxylase/phosphopantothenate--cysteine ligase CoaBC [Odoribacteraceae bacterium]|jgi:phosphopantothenoylcysteine decarboxylase/phosphopantothenate--cysteine ligase|nr:bifunctional phosphopantothenoylcysteine decarboxylase/phosphopantothenate--cysteine ligase CoaBC [Odoribacteraceae bacterium]
MLEKNILLGITGSIAAYKAATLARLLVKEGAAVKVVMSPLAKEFVTPLTMATLTKNPIAVEFFDPESGAWHSHVALGVWADLYLVAPASANTIGKMAAGVADNLLLTTYLSARCPVMIAPAMDADMYGHPAVQHNLEMLRSRGNVVVEPGCGELASGLVGKGRMEEPEQIFAAVSRFFAPRDMAGVKVLLTAGPTHEQIDPVRFIGNHSSGKMGYALAEELANRGAEAILISGPTSLSVSRAVRRVDVTSAEEMYEAAVSLFPTVDVGVLCAAVSDFAPLRVSPEKLKRTGEELQLTLRPTRDIAAALGEMKSQRQRLVGFALETGNEEANARDKMRRKNLDMIVLNSLNDAGAGFRGDTNKVTIIPAQGAPTVYPLKPKRAVAADIADKIAGILNMQR